VRGGNGDSIKLEFIMTEAQARDLSEQGLDVTINSGNSAGPSLRTLRIAATEPVFRPYGGIDGLQQEMHDLADQYPEMTSLEVIGQSGLGADILALQVTRDAGHGKKGKKLTVLYVSAQHAREWISPEVNRRLLRHFLENYDTDLEIKKIVDTAELWFVLVANPDGYDYTFTPGNRLWRKTLTDNDGDGQITGVDGVDPNRNFPTFWGYYDEGSSSNLSSGPMHWPPMALATVCGTSVNREHHIRSACIRTTMPLSGTSVTTLSPRISRIVTSSSPIPRSVSIESCNLLLLQFVIT